MRTNTTLVMNPKGGSGKTTVATNLASAFAAHGMAAAIMDYDPQGSSLNWVRLRSDKAPKIHGANAAPQKTSRLRSFDMHLPASTSHVVIDAPAGTAGLLLQDLLARADAILVPVGPSAIDIHATANFVRDLLLVGRIRARNIRLGVVANRVRPSMPAYQPLERFLGSLKLPLLARLNDSDVYLKAAETGVGIFEMQDDGAEERQQFRPIVDWVDPAFQASGSNVYELSRSGLRSITSSLGGPRRL